MKSYTGTLVAAIAIFLIQGTHAALAQTKKTDSVYENFLSPPAAARPRVWWHWMNGNITKDGIKKDLVVDEPFRHRRISKF